MQRNSNQNIEAILFKHAGHFWRDNLDDPYIYLSFSYKQLTVAYGSQPMAAIKQYVTQTPLVEYSVSIQKKYQEVLFQEWRDRAGFPIKLLRSTASKDEIRNKNVYFIFSKSYFDAESVTLAFPFENFINNRPAHFKITLSQPVYYAIEPTAYEKYIWLHEAAHAFEMKHFKKYDEGDHPPYARLDCTETVLGYEEDCKAASTARRELFPGKIDLKERDKVLKLWNSYPDHIGPLDIAAAKIVMDNWKKRSHKNQIITEETNSLGQENKPVLFFDKNILFNCIDTLLKKPSLCLIDAFNQQLDRLIESSITYAANLADNCDAYFPRQHPNYWQNNSLTLFSHVNHSDASGINAAILNSPPINLLGK